MQADRRKTTSVRFLGPVDISAIRDDILAIPEEIWSLENAAKPNRFEELYGTKHIVFRFVDSLDDWRYSHDRSLWLQWKDRLEPVLRQACKPYGYAQGVFPRVMLARMPAGGVIKPHIDSAPAASWPHKIHVPIVTNLQVRFYVDPHNYHFEVGQAYEVNNLGPHAVHNAGDTQRIHLIFEYYEDTAI
ncbi:MAG: hypothetical protein JWQ90_5643 [Hydrocarboniphaga sp.]|uniref:aspartyl/asparaginyl beta-hydroxylase domain-containing protein n=1 Tax=Hydrocarboniphaga sp. TaxID=2033016 RepID=UPI0026058BE5|nr:aspartyl/asparaginyl beta-hydroxylase domain-containing protein [Hydrocarboniphaga sp.]MDB5973193.1 hypothetical protein [Hydrocarboniphaga sp.]